MGALALCLRCAPTRFRTDPNEAVTPMFFLLIAGWHSGRGGAAALRRLRGAHPSEAGPAAAAAGWVAAAFARAFLCSLQAWTCTGLHGRLSRHNVSSHMLQMDLGADEAEGLGSMAAEAQAMGAQVGAVVASLLPPLVVVICDAGGCILLARN